MITIDVTPEDGTPTHTYTVTVARAPNTPPAFKDGATTTRGVDENTVAGQDIGDPVAATDTENDTLTYSLDATGAASFDIDESSGQLLTKAALDFEDKSSYTVTVSVRDSKDANGDADEVTDDTIRVTILVADLNEAPKFPISETGMRSVDENTVAGVNIGAPVAATDPENDTLTYSLDAVGAESFDIVAATGQLQTKAALDYETRSSYMVTVTASDDVGSFDVAVSINVTNVVEVSVEPGPSPVTEGGDVTFTLTRDAPLTDEFTVDVSVSETGSMLTGALPVSATFEAGASTTSLTLTTEDDTPIEDPSTVTVTIESDTRYQVTEGAAAADVVILDDLPRFELRVGPAEVTEGGGGAVTVEVTNNVSLATAQTISLTLSGTATADDFTLLNTSDRTLSAPYTLTIPANEGVAAAYISTVNDALPEPAETLTITASHDGTEIGTGTMTLRASPLRLELSSLTASGGGGRAMYPSFDAGTLHYAVGCDPAQPLTLRLSTTDATTRLAVNGIQQVNQNAVVELNQLDGDDDIQITLSNAGGASTTYVVHCMNRSDPFIDIVKQPGSAIELIAGSVNEGPGLGVRGHLLVIDANGVPRVHRRIDNPRVTHFRPQDNEEFPYSHAATLPDPFQSPWGARRDFEIRHS